MARTLQDHLETQIADDERKQAENPDRFRGRDWCELNDEEEQVFEIDWQRFPRMLNAWHCYEAFKGIVNEGFPVLV